MRKSIAPLIRVGNLQTVFCNHHWKTRLIAVLRLRPTMYPPISRRAIRYGTNRWLHVGLHEQVPVGVWTHRPTNSASLPVSLQHQCELHKAYVRESIYPRNISFIDLRTQLFRSKTITFSTSHTKTGRASKILAMHASWSVPLIFILFQVNDIFRQ